MIIIPDTSIPEALLLSNDTTENSSQVVDQIEPAYTIKNSNDGSGYYTPWGTAPMESGMSYFKIALGAVGIVAVFCFSVPYAVGLIVNLFNEFKNSFK